LSTREAVVSIVVLGNDPVNPLAVLILNGLDAGPHLLRNMRAEERPDGVACSQSLWRSRRWSHRLSAAEVPALLPSRGLDFFLDSAAVAIFFVARWFRHGRCFRGSRIVFRFVTSGPIPEFSMYSNRSQFFENAKPGWMREKTSAQNSRREEAGKCAGA